MPIVQIMGMSCYLYVLSLIDKGLYLLQRVYTMSYPVSNHEIRTGALQKIVRGFALMEDILQNALDISVDNNDWTSLVIEPEEYEEDRGNNEEVETEEDNDYEDDDAEDEAGEDEEVEDEEVEDEDKEGEEAGGEEESCESEV
ncbi:hypothetical protein HMPREF1544_03402 [Mucor circinelloides 1006PhL]|uniref:Uncharacterized protein n=1 Tax=Mucor circinelloides f. circinelloides (strain 1006PhL) TaxID=1220926 RepID=S2JIK9_MUCC1|nr:hypothetical protein HMPREF1544_03402 [Mucor circinelloides 1006PhL]